MICHGVPPFLECSSAGEKRLSAFYAQVGACGGRTIETIYQASKIFEDGVTGLNWRDAKGRRAINMDSCIELYSWLWNTYINENKDLLTLIKSASGLSDKFGQPGHCCQATELWRIRNALGG